MPSFSMASAPARRCTSYRMEGVFGKWCRPNYNSVVATFCHNIAHGLPIQVRDPGYELPLVYIDDVVDLYSGCHGARRSGAGRGGHLPHPSRPPHHAGRPGLRHRGLCQGPWAAPLPRLSAPTVCPPWLCRILTAGSFEKKLYCHLSVLPAGGRVCLRPEHALRQPGQLHRVSAHPRAGPGQREHLQTRHRQGQSLASHQEREVPRRQGRRQSSASGRSVSDQVIEYRVSGEKLQVVDIPCGYTHNIENVGEGELVTVMWANEAL